MLRRSQRNGKEPPKTAFGESGTAGQPNILRARDTGDTCEEARRASPTSSPPAQDADS